jgi:hypothetical protein
MKTSKSHALFISILIVLLSPVLHATEVTVKVVDPENRPIVDMIVYLMPLEEQSVDEYKVPPLVINQAERKFKPYLSVVQKGLALTFNNEDDITHQIYSASASNRFSLRVKSGDKKSIEPLKNTGKILMGCNIHDWMGGYLLVLDTPLYTKTNEAGIAKIQVSEDGEYQLSVWHPQLMEEDQTHTRKININNSNNFDIKLSNSLADIPTQESPESSDFVDDY